MTKEEFKDLALSFPGTAEHAHFDRIAFKVVNKRIFSTLHEDSLSANFKFSPSEQAEFCSFDENAIYPVPNKWGEQGWTTIDLSKVDKDVVLSALESSYNDVVKPKK